MKAIFNTTDRCIKALVKHKMTELFYLLFKKMIYPKDARERPNYTLLFCYLVPCM